MEVKGHGRGVENGVREEEAEEEEEEGGDDDNDRKSVHVNGEADAAILPGSAFGGDDAKSCAAAAANPYLPTSALAVDAAGAMETVRAAEE